MKHLLLTVTCILFSGVLMAQKKQDSDLIKNPHIKNYVLSKERHTPSLINLNQKEELIPEALPEFLKQALKINNNTFQITQSKTSNSKNGTKVIKYKASVNGHPIEHGTYSAFVKDNKVQFISLEHYDLNTINSSSASLSNDQARQFATNYVGADLYVWDQISNELATTVNLNDIQTLEHLYEEHFPVGELVYVDDYNTKEAELILAYKFNIYASEPLYRSYVYVDANTGQILLEDAIIKHADEINAKIKANKEKIENKKKSNASYFFSVPATGDTRFAGTRTFQTTEDLSDPSNPKYSLFGDIVVNIDGSPVTITNETRSYDGVGGAPIGLPSIPSYSIYDGEAPIDQTEVEIGDNNWSADEHWRDRFTTGMYPTENETNNDDIALDAHWGAEIVIQYWANVHNRSSFDDLGTEIKNYVHYGDAYDNAFWNGSAMTYGDGSSQGGTNPNGSFAPLTSMDVCGHEIGHGVCQNTANLVYARESGAMNEGFSDIWAACVENYVLTQIDASLPYDPWGVGEQIDDRDNGAGPGDANSRALRWMDDPKAAGDPDCYGGENWTNPECGEPTLANDQCGVHSNSGVLNKWFYLLVTGSGSTISPGKDKAATDDEINDEANSYSVEGLGFTVAEQIAFQSELMLTANSKFIDMRNASINYAKTTYGDFSNEVKQVTNAWYAVCIGDAYLAPDPNQVSFNLSNPSLVEEATTTNGCSESKTITVDITGNNVQEDIDLTLDFSDSTASLGEDFDTSATSVSFTGGTAATPTDETKQITLTIYNDGVIEGEESIVIKFTIGTEVKTQTILINDDDFAPTIGSEAFELLNETFSVSTIPTGWETESPLEAQEANLWKFNGDTPTTSGLAYIEDKTTPGTGPNYNGTQAGNNLLKTNAINAQGITNVTVSFDWEAGGEADASGPFDYGEFLYSLDGTNFTSVEIYHGPVTANGATTDSGTYNAAIPELDNKPFFLAWRWYNDTLLGTTFSFTIDNVLVTGTPSAVESDATHSDSETVKATDQVYFLSDQDGGVLGIIENATADLGCVTLSVLEAGNGVTAFSNLQANHSNKIYKIEADGANAATASYDVTLYYTATELTGLTDLNSAQIIKVSSDVLDDASDSESNYTLSGGLLATNEDQNYSSFKGTFTGNSTFALYELTATANTNTFKNSEFKIYPTLIENNSSITVSNSKTPIEEVSIYSITGALIKSSEFNNSTTVSIPLANLASGMYFIKINGNTSNNTYKFIVK